MRLVTTAEMRRLEQAAVDAGSTWAGLMEQAGWGVAQEAVRCLAHIRDQHAVVLVGPGNNGGDGLVVARHLHDAGARVVLYLWNRSGAETDANWQRCRQRQIAEVLAADDSAHTELRAVLAQADLVVDALLGMGVSRPVAGDLAEIVSQVNAAHRGPRAPLVLSIDLPTGVQSDDGAVPGAALRADVTVATGLPKRGLLLYPGRSCAGTLVVAEIGIPPDELEKIMSDAIYEDQARELLPDRPDDSHKGTFGKVMVVAGSLRYPGAAGLATSGAGRVGAGLVTLAAARTILAGTGRGPEVTLLPLPEAELGTLGAAAAEEVLQNLEGYRALLIGPGLGQAKETGECIQRLVLQAPQTRPQARVGFRPPQTPAAAAAAQRAAANLPPLVIDADGLNLLAASADWPERLPRECAVLTPHPGEMKRLLKVDELGSDRVQVALDAAAQWGQVVVLKGATTVVAAPDGRSAVYDGGNAALATAGTGDVLAGAIAGLLAQGLPLFAAATLGVYLHGEAGVLVRADLGDAGALATDLLPRLPLVIKRLKQARS